MPKPEVEVKSDHTSLHVTIKQGDDCDANAIVKHWRVTHCTQAASEEDARKHYYDEDSHVAGSGNGGGGDDSDDDNSDDDEFYYYDEAAKSGKGQSHTKCSNKLYTLTEGKKDFTIDGLSECTMYTVDLSPADASGHVLQPGEDYGSVHSTFCMNKNQAKDQSSNFFFENNPTKGFYYEFKVFQFEKKQARLYCYTNLATQYVTLSFLI